MGGSKNNKMKLIFILFVVLMVGCSNPYPEKDFTEDYRRLERTDIFIWSANKHNENTTIWFRCFEEKKRDSAMFYSGKMHAYSEMSNYLNQLNK